MITPVGISKNTIAYVSTFIVNTNLYVASIQCTDTILKLDTFNKVTKHYIVQILFSLFKVCLTRSHSCQPCSIDTGPTHLLGFHLLLWENVEMPKI